MTNKVYLIICDNNNVLAFERSDDAVVVCNHLLKLRDLLQELEAKSTTIDLPNYFSHSEIELIDSIDLMGNSKIVFTSTNIL
jgi:hypothetical protein